MDSSDFTAKDELSGEQPRSMKLSSRPNRVRVLPPGPVSSEFNPCKDCNLNLSGTHFEFDGINSAALPFWQSPVSPVKRSNKNVVWNWKPREGYVLPESTDDAFQIIPELASPPARPPRGVPRPLSGRATVAFRSQRPAPIAGRDHLLGSLNFSMQNEATLSLPLERSNLTLLQESSINEPSSSAAAMKSLTTIPEHEPNGVIVSTFEKNSTEANCLCCCFTTFCLVMSIVLLTASAVLAIVHGAEVYRRKVATLDPDNFFYTLPGTVTEKATPFREPVAAPSCEPYIVEPCLEYLNYNYTGFPNLVGHNTSKDLDKDLSLFREVMDGECYALSSSLLCALLQPECDPVSQQKLRLPCRRFCEYFLHKCNSSIPEKIRQRINCYHLGTENCTARPACAEELRALKEDDKICNGNVDCEDRSDEAKCPTEPPILNSTSDDRNSEKWYASADPFR